MKFFFLKEVELIGPIKPELEPELTNTKTEAITSDTVDDIMATDVEQTGSAKKNVRAV